MIAEALRGLRSGRVWLAALAASLLAFGLLIPLGMVTQRVLPAFMPAAMLEWWLNTAYLLDGALVEGCKLAALWWLLRRDTGRWFALGIAYGTLAACWGLWQLVGNAIRFPGFVTPSIGWVVPLAASIVLHGTLGVLHQTGPAAGEQRPDPAAVAVVVLGIGFLGAMVAQRSVLPWMRGTPQA